MWKCATVVIIIPRQVNHGYHYDTSQAREDTNKLFNSEQFHLEQRTEYKRPYAASGCENRRARNARILQTSRDEVVCEEPQEAEFQAQHCGLANGEHGCCVLRLARI